MANRRMIAKNVIFTDRFDSLTHVAKDLYFYMILDADDDGFIDSVNKLMKYLGTNRKSLDMLTERGFVIEFSSGVCLITHWHLHNCVPKDRYTHTNHDIEYTKVYQIPNKEYRLKPSK